MPSLECRKNGVFHIRFRHGSRNRSMTTGTADREAAVDAMKKMRPVPLAERKGPVALDPGIYLVYSPSTGLTKIGSSGNLPARVRALKQQSDSMLEVVAAIRCDDYFRIEKVLHSKFEGRRVRGEWFRFDAPSLGRAVAIATRICERHCEHFIISDSQK